MSSNVNSGSQSYKKRTRRKNNGLRIFLKILLFIISIAIWGAVVYYGYTYAKAYIDTSIESVQQSNMMAVEQIKEEIKIVNSEIRSLRNEIKDLEDELEDTDSTLSSTTDIQENLEDKLKNLDSRLNKLQESLNILGEAPNVKN